MPIQYTPILDDDTPIISSVVPLHHDYVRFRDDWTKCRDAIAGETRVKSKDIEYLPPLPSHTNDNNRYKAYLKRATFYNSTHRTLEGLVGSIFRKSPVINDLPDDTIVERLHLRDLTQDGESIYELSNILVTETLSVGRVGILLDRPQLKFQDEDIPVVDGEDDSPYITVYRAENILNWRSVKVGRRRVLQQVVLREVVPDPEAIGHKDKERIRMLELDPNGVYYQYLLTDSGLPDNDTIVYPSNQGRPIRYIPFIFINPKSLNPEVEKPPMLDIVQMNFSHYRSYAALEHGRAYTAFPQFYVSFRDNDQFPAMNYDNPSEQGDAANADGAYRVDSDAVWEIEGGTPGILEYQGSGLNSLENALEKKEGQIQALGARLITPLKGLPAQSAVVYELQSLGDAAILLQLANQVAKTMDIIVKWMADWEQVLLPTPRPSFSFTASFTDTKVTARELRAILALYKEHAIPKDALYHTLREAGVLPPRMTLEEFKTLLDDPDQVWQLDDRPAIGR